MLISKRYTFEASHILPKHPGKCSRLHGHSYGVLVQLEGVVDEESQFVLDYAQLDEVVKPMIDFLDHRHLNLVVQYPSAENLATFFGNQFQRLIDGDHVARLVIEVSETAKTVACWDSARPLDWRRAFGEGGWRMPEPPAPIAPPDDGTLQLQYFIIGKHLIEDIDHQNVMQDFYKAKRTVADAINQIRRKWQGLNQAIMGSGGGLIVEGGK